MSQRAHPILLKDLQRGFLGLSSRHKQRRYRHNHGQLGNKSAIPLDAAIDADTSASGRFGLSDGRVEEFGHANAIEKLLAHFYSPAFRWRTEQTPLFGCGQLNSARVGPLLHTIRSRVARRSHTEVSVPKLEHVGSAPKHFRERGINAGRAQ